MQQDHCCPAAAACIFIVSSQASSSSSRASSLSVLASSLGLLGGRQALLGKSMAIFPFFLFLYIVSPAPARSRKGSHASSISALSGYGCNSRDCCKPATCDKKALSQQWASLVHPAGHTCVLFDVSEHDAPCICGQPPPHSHLGPLHRLYPGVEDEGVLPCKLICREHSPAHTSTLSLAHHTFDRAAPQKTTSYLSLASRELASGLLELAQDSHFGTSCHSLLAPHAVPDMHD